MVHYVYLLKVEKSDMNIRKSAEDYLETMLMLKEEKGYIRSIDIAHHMGVTKPSVSYATKNLRENGYISMDKDGLITLTETGMEIAQKMYGRHKILTEFLVRLGVDRTKIEHDLSEESFRAICNHAATGKLSE